MINRQTPIHKIGAIAPAFLLKIKLGFTKATKLLYDGLFGDIKA